jgi:hypothetical protein
MCVVCRLDMVCVHGGSLCLRSKVVLAIVYVNGFRRRKNRHDLGRDVVNLNEFKLCMSLAERMKRVELKHCKPVDAAGSE